jgi:sugar phosphate isomerase/epimerase
VRKLSLASGMLPEFGAVDVVRAGAEAGFEAVGFWVDPAEWTAADTRAARLALAGTDLSLLDVEVVWIKPDSDLDAHRRIIDIGAELGAANVLCVSSDPDMGALLPSCQPCAATPSVRACASPWNSASSPRSGT